VFSRSFAVKGECFAGNGESGPNPDTNGQSPSFGGKLDSEQSEYMTFLGWIDFTDEDRQRAQEYLRSLSDADQIEPQFTELADQYQRLEQCVGNEIDLRDSKRHPGYAWPRRAFEINVQCTRSTTECSEVKGRGGEHRGTEGTK
jgi:hypothetical protein